jgi:integrase
MKPLLLVASPRVKTLDSSTTPRNGPPRPTRRELRFREALPDFKALLWGQTNLPLDDFTLDAFARWCERWSMRTLSSVTPEELQAYFHELGLKGFPARDIDKEKSLLRALYRWAVRSGWSSEDPSNEVSKTRTLPLHPVLVWTSSEQERLLEVCRWPWARHGVSAPGSVNAPLYLYPLTLISLRTGLRLGHVLNLEWRHVDLVARRIHIPAREVHNGRDIEVAMDADVYMVLRVLSDRARATRQSSQRVLEIVGLPLWKGRADEHAALHAFRLARRTARIPDGDFNSLQLTFASNCARAGVPLEYTLGVSDWDDPSLIETVYRANVPSPAGEGTRS